jgi:hypothetical protein
LIKGLESSNVKVDLQKIAHALALYEDIVLPHLKEEEEIGLLLFRAYFSPIEARAIIEQIVKKTPSTEMGSFIYFVVSMKYAKPSCLAKGFPSSSGIFSSGPIMLTLFLLSTRILFSLI